MSLKHRIKKLETRLRPNEQIHIICADSDSLEAKAAEFLEQNPDFDGLLIKVIDIFKPENAGT